MIRPENALKISLQDVLKISWRRLGKTYWRCLEDVLKTSSKRLEDVFKMSWRRFCKTSWRCLENVLKTSWRRMVKTNILVLTNTSWRRLQEIFWRWRRKIFKTSSSRWMFAGMCLTLWQLCGALLQCLRQGWCKFTLMRKLKRTLIINNINRSMIWWW